MNVNKYNICCILKFNFKSLKENSIINRCIAYLLSKNCSCT